jgi:protein AaeX
VKLSEINLLGVYVAPIFVVMAVAWVLLLILRRLAVLCGLTKYVWHPPLFSLAVYVIVVSSIVLILAR